MQSDLLSQILFTHVKVVSILLLSVYYNIIISKHCFLMPFIFLKLPHLQRFIGAAAGSGDGAGRGIKLIPGTEILPCPPSKYLQLPVADPGFG